MADYVVSFETAAGIKATKAVGKVYRAIVMENKLLVDLLFYYDAAAKDVSKEPMTLKTHEFVLEKSDLDAIMSVVQKYLDPLDSVYTGPPKIDVG